MTFTFDYWILGLPSSINHSNHHGLRSSTTAATLLLLLLASPATAQPSSPNSPTDNYYNPKFSPSMGVVIIILISALFLMGFFSMYIRSCSEDTSAASVSNRAATARSRRGPRGLEPTVIESFPTFEYAAVKSLHLGKDALECAICLNEFEDDETLRLIPKCDHVFHPECIGEWLGGHTTCPVCRTDLIPQPGEESFHVPTNLPSELTQICELGHGHPHSDDEHIPSQPNQTGAEVVIQVVGQPILPPLPPTATDIVSGDKRDLQQGGGGVVVDYPYPPPPPPEVASDSTSKRLNRNRTRKWLGAMFTRSNSTGHVAVKQWENMDRFTLRIPDDVRKQIISGKLNRTTSLLVLPAGEGSSRRGYRVGDGGSSRGGVGRRLDRSIGGGGGRSDRWVFSMMPPFFSRASSMRSQRLGGSRSVSRRSGRDGSIRSNRDGDSVRDGSVRSNRDEGSVKGDGGGSTWSNRGDESGLPPV